VDRSERERRLANLRAPKSRLGYDYSRRGAHRSGRQERRLAMTSSNRPQPSIRRTSRLS